MNTPVNAKPKLNWITRIWVLKYIIYMISSMQNQFNFGSQIIHTLWLKDQQFLIKKKKKRKSVKKFTKKIAIQYFFQHWNNRIRHALFYHYCVCIIRGRAPVWFCDSVSEASLITSKDTEIRSASITEWFFLGIDIVCGLSLEFGFLGSLLIVCAFLLSNVSWFFTIIISSCPLFIAASWVSWDDSFFLDDKYLRSMDVIERGYLPIYFDHWNLGAQSTQWTLAHQAAYFGHITQAMTQKSSWDWSLNNAAQQSVLDIAEDNQTMSAEQIRSIREQYQIVRLVPYISLSKTSNYNS